MSSDEEGVLPGVSIDPWDLRHLLLSLDDRPRNPEDGRDLDAVVRRAVEALTLVPQRPPVEVPTVLTAPIVVESIALWLFETNSWLIAPEGPGGECVVIDVPPSPDALVDRIQALALRPVAVLLTHAHLDHVFGVAALLAALPGPVPAFLHPADRLVLRREGRGLLARASSVDYRASARALMPLDDVGILAVGPANVRPIHTPGHTPGSTCFLVEGGARPLLVTGDVLFAGGTGRCDRAAGSRATARASLRALLAQLPDDTVVLPGHGPLTTVARERADHLPLGPLAREA